MEGLGQRGGRLDTLPAPAPDVVRDTLDARLRSIITTLRACQDVAAQMASVIGGPSKDPGVQKNPEPTSLNHLSSDADRLARELIESLHAIRSALA